LKNLGQFFGTGGFSDSGYSDSRYSDSRYSDKVEQIYQFIQQMVHPTKLLPLTSQTKLTLTLTLTLTLALTLSLNPKTKLTLERGTNPTKPY